MSAAAAGDMNGAIDFTVGDYGATPTELRLFARTRTYSSTAFIRIAWVACGYVNELVSAV